MSDQAVALLQALKSAMARRDRAAVNAACSSLIAADVPLGSQWQAIAAALQHNGEHGAALRAVETWQRQGEGSSAARFQHAVTLARAGRPGDAREILERLPDHVPDAAGNAYLKGTVSLNLGQTDRALAELRRAVGLNPRSGQAWLALAMAAPLATGDAGALRAGAEAFAAVPDNADKASFFYALGKLEDQDGNHDAAFGAFARGAAIMAALRPWDAGLDDEMTRDAIGYWSRARIDAVADREAGASRSIFVTGLPRSGTTLVEQILASHSAVAGGDELGLFRIIGQDLGGLRSQDWERFTANGGDPRDLRRLYDHLVDQRFPQPGRVVDKTLATSRYFGIVAALFPDAPIVWLRRDPVDAAWSAFRTYFARGVDWSWALHDIAGYFRNEDRLFDHWTRELGDRILIVPYAELVSEPREWTERITRHAGLEMEEAQLAPHLSDRAVTTASVTQVREAIHGRGVGSAEPYREFMGAFLESYAADEAAR